MTGQAFNQPLSGQKKQQLASELLHLRSHFPMLVQGGYQERLKSSCLYLKVRVTATKQGFKSSKECYITHIFWPAVHLTAILGMLMHHYRVQRCIKTSSFFFFSIFKRVIIRIGEIIAHGGWNSLLVRALDLWLKGCEFEFPQKWWENFLLQS